jgi:hypothetical protein
MQNDKNYARLKNVQPKFSPGWDEINGKIISTWNLGIIGCERKRNPWEDLNIQHTDSSSKIKAYQKEDYK